jgi:hypothetical protein
LVRAAGVRFVSFDLLQKVVQLCRRQAKKMLQVAITLTFVIIHILSTPVSSPVPVD